MGRQQIDHFEAARETFDRLRSPGALLVAGTEKPNIMTIGWGTLGVIWGKPVFTVLVRPSRHTYSFLEEHAEFTVCIPTPEMKKEVMLCGTKSGRDIDKIAECNFTMIKGEKAAVPYIEQCPIHYECRVVHRNNVLAPKLDGGIVGEYYPSEDYHTIYFGEILGAFMESTEQA